MYCGLLISVSQGPLLNRTVLFYFCEAGYGCSCSISCYGCCVGDGYGYGPLLPFSSLFLFIL